MINHWIEAMRLRTLPVSIAGVIAGIGVAIMMDSFNAVPALICMVFAILAQVASNFANEYYDFENGIDKRGRSGFRRGVAEGEISPQAMKRASLITLFLASVVGCFLLFYGQWWLLVVGGLIVLFALAYSAGPYPLSHHGLGDIAVVLFFGIVPVVLTCYLQVCSWDCLDIALPTSIAIGLLAANVLVVNNYRDMEDDAAAGKCTTVVIFGRKKMGLFYLFSGIFAMAMMFPIWSRLPLCMLAIPLIYLLMHIFTWYRVISAKGAELNPLLGRTAINLFLFALMFLLGTIFK